MLVIYHFIQVFGVAVLLSPSRTVLPPETRRQHEPDQFIATEKVVSPSGSAACFNGLAQVIMGPERKPAKFKLTARADGLTLATTIVQAKACPPRPSVPSSAGGRMALMPVHRTDDWICSLLSCS